ncbi:MAG: helix-turn-helix domain-containing protein [Bacteroidota bacterium]
MKRGVDIRQILGLKVRELRTDRNLSYQELSRRTGLSVSYLNEIEKGKKYPKGDKIIQLSEALDVSYDYLVSLKVSKKIEPVVSLLQSSFFKELPLEMMGLDTQKFMELISANPEKINTFINTVLQIARSYEMNKENVYHAALRSFQEINDNYFDDLEQAVQDFKEKYDFESTRCYDREDLVQTLRDYFGISVSYKHLSGSAALKNVRSYFHVKDRSLFLNKGLTQAQEKFLIVRELAYSFLEIEDRPVETPPQRQHTFTQLLNNFKASYFAVAFLMDRDQMIDDIKAFVKSKKWHDRDVLDIMKSYEATPEMLMQRLTNILPRYFGFNNLFFLKMVSKPGEEGFRLTKELHLSKLHNPYGNELNEHYCRRWISVGIIRELQDHHLAEPIARLQISKYFNTKSHYLCLSIAIPNSSDSDEGLSLTVGFQIGEELRKRIAFLDDPDIVAREVHTTCERCPVSDCGERAAPAWKLEKHNEQLSIEQALKALG